MTATTSTDIQRAAYLREQRQFPFENVKDLSRQVDQAYIDIANKVNKRVIGTYAIGFSTVTGQSWYFTGTTTRQQTLRQIYTFIANGGVNIIPHNIPSIDLDRFTMIYGTAKSGTNYYPLPYVVSSGSVTRQISIDVDATNITVTEGATSPGFTEGLIVLEYLVQN